ncbi:hypothetical protein JTB14_021069 [Gonioctena quinquepunctata]|nr:hypothetical protein JTB14_021069 [Gonioctena quinquepunctata]
MTTYLTESPDLDMATIIPENVNQTETNDNYEVFMMFNKNLTSRYPRQELNETEDDPEFRNKDNQSQEDDSEEGNGNMLTGLLSAFLGTLSKPDGSIDIEAIVGLLGSLSTQNPDGTYDFQGLTDLLQGFFGGGGGEGGSDVGAFVGGLLGAVIKGLANPPGPKGAGVLTGKIVSGILPALSVPDKTDDDDMPDDKKPPTEEVLDSGSFLSGILKTIFGASSGQGGGMINIVQSVKTSIKSLFTSSSKSPMSMG